MEVALEMAENKSMGYWGYKNNGLFKWPTFRGVISYNSIYNW